jgi:hypothetical protein
MKEHSIYIFSIVVLLAAIIRINKLNERVEQLEARKLITIHRADNAGAEMHGRITGKELIDGRYTVTAGAYGKFLVTKEQYDALEIGDEIPDYLRGVGR